VKPKSDVALSKKLGLVSFRDCNDFALDDSHAIQVVSRSCKTLSEVAEYPLLRDGQPVFLAGDGVKVVQGGRIGLHELPDEIELRVRDRGAPLLGDRLEGRDT
jgi:hypothetical protein